MGCGTCGAVPAGAGMLQVLGVCLGGQPSGFLASPARAPVCAPMLCSAGTGGGRTTLLQSIAAAPTQPPTARCLTPWRSTTLLTGRGRSTWRWSGPTGGLGDGRCTPRCKARCTVDMHRGCLPAVHGRPCLLALPLPYSPHQLLRRASTCRSAKRLLAAEQPGVRLHEVSTPSHMVPAEGALHSSAVARCLMPTGGGAAPGSMGCPAASSHSTACRCAHNTIHPDANTHATQ